MTAYFKREFLAYFRSPVGWVCLALYALISGFYFASWIPAGGVNIASEMNFLSGTLFIIIPVITMRLFSEERKSGTDVIMYTYPIRLAGVVVAKYLAALSLFLLMNGIVIVHMLFVSLFGGRIDATSFTSFIALILLGSVFIAIGTMASAVTENQIIAALISFSVILLSQFITVFSEQFRELTVSLLSALNVFGISAERIAGFGAGVEKAINWMDPHIHLDGLFNGIFQVQPLIFCISAVIVFLFVAYRMIEKRRWS